MFCIEDISGKILRLLTLQRLLPSWLPVPWIADFYAFIIGGVFTVKLYIYSVLRYIYSFDGLAYAVSTPYTLCISFKDRYFALLFLTSAILLRFHCLFAFWSVVRASRCGRRYAFPCRVSLDELGVSLGLCIFSVRLHSSHFSFSARNSPPHPPVRCLFPCHSAVIP